MHEREPSDDAEHRRDNRVGEQPLSYAGHDREHGHDHERERG